MAPESLERVPLRYLVRDLSSGVSVNSVGRPRGAGEIGVLKTSAVTSGFFRPEENKVVLPEEVARARVSPRSGTILVSRMNTVNLVGASAYVSQDHPDLVLPDRLWQLELDTGRVDGRWLHQFLLAPITRSRISEMAGGTSGSMKNISQGRFLALEVTLPPIEYQRKTAAVLASLDESTRSSEAVVGQLRVLKDAMVMTHPTKGIPGRHLRFKSSTFGEIPASWDARPLAEISEQVRREVIVDIDATYAEIGVRSHGKGIFHKPPILGADLGSKRVFYVEPGCIIVNIVFAWEGAVAATSHAESGMIASHRFPMFRPRKEVVDLDYLRLVLQTRRGIELLGTMSPGGAGRNKTLNQDSLKRLVIPLPPLNEQKLISAAIRSVEDELVASAKSLEQLRRLKVELMTVLFSGDAHATAQRFER